VHVVPSHISHMSKRYEAIIDAPSKETANHDKYPQSRSTLEPVVYDSMKLWPRDPIVPYRGPDKLREYLHDAPTVKIRAIVTEASNGSSLHFVYQASVTSSSVDINPAQFTKRLLLSSTTLLTSDHGPQKNLDKQRLIIHNLPFECASIRDGWDLSIDQRKGLPHHGDLRCCIWNLP
jgi:hypothetical protein